MIKHIRRAAPFVFAFCLSLYLASFAQALEPEQGSSATIVVDFTRAESRVNRALFSLVNYQRFASEAGATARALFSRLGPAESIARTEVMIDLIEPANDNNDSAVFNWSRLYTDRMYRFIHKDGEAFLNEMTEMAMMPLALLTYNVEWLGRGGQRNAPPTDPAEWAEFAAAVVETMSRGLAVAGEDRDLLVEIWNEPSPGGPYWTGTRDEYFELFRTTADRIHRDYPGVLVGGPSVLSSDGAFLLEFIQECGESADFITAHFYNQDPVRMARRISDWAEFIEEATGRRGTLHITESDNWNLRGWDKVDYVLTRQFELIARSNEIGSFHHFSLPYYREAPGRVFGLLRPDGRIVAENYLPYLLFSGFRGEEVGIDVELAGIRIDPLSDHRDPLPVYAAASRDQSSYTTTAYLREASIAGAEFVFRLPDEIGPWTLRVDQLGRPNGVATVAGNAAAATFRTQEFRSGAGGGRVVVEVDPAAGAAVRITLRETANGPVDVVLDNARNVVSVINGSTESVRGQLHVLALPSGRRTRITSDVAVPASGRVDVETDVTAAMAEGDTQVTAIFEPLAPVPGNARSPSEHRPGPITAVPVMP